MICTLGIRYARRTLVVALSLAAACSTESTPAPEDLAHCDTARCERPTRAFFFELPMGAGRACRCALPCEKDDDCPEHHVCNGAVTTGLHAPVEGPKLACVQGTHGIEVNKAVESFKDAVKPD